MHHIVKSGLQYYFALEAKGTRLANAELAMRRLDLRLARVRERWSLTPEMEVLRGEFNISLGLLHRTYDATKDTMIGGSVPVEFDYPHPVGGIDWTITHRVDAIFAKNRKVHGIESYVMLNVLDPMDPYERRVRYGELAYGYLSFLARESLGLQAGLPVQVVNFPLSKPPVSTPLTASGRPEFMAFADNVLALMATEAAIPTGDPVKCIECPFTYFCKPSLASITRDREHVGARRRLRNNVTSNKSGMMVRRPTGD